MVLICGMRKGFDMQMTLGREVKKERKKRSRGWAGAVYNTRGYATKPI
jgi:hypothetical protein